MHENNYKSSWVIGNLSSSASVREGTRSAYSLKNMQANLQSPQPLLVGGKSENNIPDLFGVLAPLAEIWLNCVELLQSLFGSFSPASEQLQDQLIKYEHYNLANQTCTKCKILTVIP
jgi:hypothetical protein